MSEELTTFDTKDLQERITHTVRNQFGMLIPEDSFNALIKKEISAFFDEETNATWEKQRITDASYYGASKQELFSLKVTPFRYMVWKEVSTIVKQHLDEAFGNPDFHTAINYQYDVTGNQSVECILSDMLNRKLEEIAPKMAAAMFRNMFGEAVVTAKSEIRNDLITQGFNI